MPTNLIGNLVARVNLRNRLATMSYGKTETVNILCRPAHRLSPSKTKWSTKAVKLKSQKYALLVVQHLGFQTCKIQKPTIVYHRVAFGGSIRSKGEAGGNRGLARSGSPAKLVSMARGNPRVAIVDLSNYNQNPSGQGEEVMGYNKNNNEHGLEHAVGVSSNWKPAFKREDIAVMLKSLELVPKTFRLEASSSGSQDGMVTTSYLPIRNRNQSSSSHGEKI